MCMGATGITMESDDLRDDVVNGVLAAMETDKNSGAVLLKGSALPPFAADVQEQTGLPVFDFLACIESMQRAVITRRYSGFMWGLKCRRSQFPRFGISIHEP